MKIIRQQRINLHRHDAFVFRVWRKRAYVAGWYAYFQIAGKAWMMTPDEPKTKPERYTK